MAFAFCRIEKIKTAGSLVSAYNHNARKVEVENANPDLIDMNEDLVTLPLKENGEEMRYDEAFKDRISTLPYYQDAKHKIRSNQVLGYEIILAYTPDETVDHEEWKKRCVEWLKQEFDVAPDNRSNVLSAIYHGDESGNGHIHAFVVPIDEKGHLNATRFTNGSRALRNIQDSHADYVKDLGIERGVSGSSAKFKVIQKLYADLNNAINIPDPMEGETATEYKARIVEGAETLYAVRKKQGDDYARRVRQETDRFVAEQRDAIAAELDATNNLYASDIAENKKRAQKAKEQVDTYTAQVEALTQQMWELKTTVEAREVERAGAIRAARIQVGIEIIRAEDPARAEHLEGEVNYAIERATAREVAEQNLDILQEQPDVG